MEALAGLVTVVAGVVLVVSETLTLRPNLFLFGLGVGALVFGGMAIGDARGRE